MRQKVAWDRVSGDGVVDGFVNEIHKCVAPMLNSVYSAWQ